MLLARGELVNAADAYAAARDIRLIHHQPQLAWQSQAGLARVRLAQGRSDQALRLVEPIIAQLAEFARNRIEDPALLWWNCYVVLRSTGDKRARAVLDQAYTIVQERAACISDAAFRRQFLHNVAVNRQIVAHWQAAAPMAAPTGSTGAPFATVSGHGFAVELRQPSTTVPGLEVLGWPETTQLAPKTHDKGNRMSAVVAEAE